MRIKFKIKIVIILSLLLIIYSNTFSFRTVPKNSDQTLLQLDYYGIVRSDLLAINYNKKIYIPFMEIINQLRIYNEYDYSQNKISGYFEVKDSSFKIDFQTGKGEIFGRTVEINDSLYLIDKTEIYILPELIEKLFNFTAEINTLRLSLKIDSPYDLPIKRAYKRFVGYSFTDNKKSKNDIDFGPLKFDRSPSYLNGGTIVYDLRYSDSKNYRNYGYNVNSGIEILAGDLQFNSSGNYNETYKKFYNKNQIKWRYNFGENPYISNLNIGNIFTSNFRTSTLPSNSFTGLQITNEDIKNNVSFSQIIYEEKLEPGWQVDLYKNGFLFEHKVTDAQGYYKIVLPVDYGGSNVELRYYGPKGQYLQKKELVQIPNEFLVPGEVKYSINLGKKEFEDYYFSEFRLFAGITNWLSNSISLLKYDSTNSISSYFKQSDFISLEKLNIFNSLSIRFLSNLFGTFDYAKDKMYSVKLNFWPIDFGSYRFEYAKFQGSSDLNYNNSNQYYALYVNLPNSQKFPLSINFDIRRDEYNNYSTNRLNSNIYFSLFSLFISSNYTLNFTEKGRFLSSESYSQLLTTNINYNLNTKYRYLDFIDNTSFVLTNAYNITDNELQSVNFTINQSIFKRFNLSFQMNKNFSSNQPINYSLGIRTELNYFRTQSDLKYSEQDNGLSFEQGLQGIIGYNSSLNDLVLTNSTIFSNIGSGAANIRVFQDDNSNEKYDEGEKLIPNVKIDVPNATVNRLSGGNMTQVYNLTSYQRYNVNIDKTSFKNPLIIPLFTNFSFIADPNSYKQIDVPCYAGAVIEGEVSSITDGKKEGVSGVKIHLKKKDGSYYETVPVFTGGSFYKMGVPPGDYSVWVDSVQLEILELEPRERYKNFIIQRTTNGDYVGDLNFVLMPKIQKISVPREKNKEVAPKKDSVSTASAPIAENKINPEKVDSVAKKIEKKIINTFKYGKIESVQFPKSKVTFLSPANKRYLDKIVDFMKSNPKSRLQIIGHSDNFGSLDENLEVSRSRSSAVASYLVQNGIDKFRLLMDAKGALEPIGDNSPQGRLKNMRVELFLLEE